MRTYTVRVVPRSGRTAVEVAPDGSLTIRVRSAPTEGQANREAARALAAHLDVPPTTVSLQRGARSRVKTYVVEGPSAPGGR
jgi:uncharacterized protein YggU (UPF0235/DUF167 family)